jgi:hypothetical protein
MHRRSYPLAPGRKMPEESGRSRRGIRMEPSARGKLPDKYRRLIRRLLLFALLLGIPALLLVRAVHQNQLNHDLLTAIKANDIPLALDALNTGADPNSRNDSNQPPPSLKERIQQIFNKLLKRLLALNQVHSIGRARLLDDRATALIVHLQTHHQENPVKNSTFPPPLSPNKATTSSLRNEEGDRNARRT